MICICINSYSIGYGVVANIIASHAIARGSIPRIRIVFTERYRRIMFPNEMQNTLPSSSSFSLPVYDDFTPRMTVNQVVSCFEQLLTAE